MDQRFARAGAAVAAALVVCAGCGTGSATGGSAPAVTLSPTAAASGVPSVAPSSEAADAASAAPSDASTSVGSTDPRAQTKQVRSATTTFVRTVLTIGYPDKTFGDYTARIEPLMTERGFASLESADSVKQGSTALTSLYAQRARSAPRLTGEPDVTSIDATSATATVAYENLAQQRSGDGWKTLRSLGKGSTTVRLVLVDRRWLVDNAS